MKELVSIVIPVYNRADLLERTLQSIVRQTYRPLELILVDNGSVDNSVEVCESFRARTNCADFTVHVASEPGGGANAARNRGLSMATGKYISFYDSDDEMLPNRMNRTVEELTTHSLDAVFFGLTLEDEAGNRHPKMVMYSTKVEDQVLISMLTTLSFVARREFIVDLGGWTAGLQRWQDWELGVRMLMAQPKCRWIEGECFDIVHEHEASITGRTFSGSATALHTSVNKVRGYLQTSPKHYKKALRALYFRESQLAVHCKREGNEEAGACFREDMKRNYPQMPLFRIAVWLLEGYTACGGRGAWRIVRNLL